LTCAQAEIGPVVGPRRGVDRHLLRERTREVTGVEIGRKLLLGSSGFSTRCCWYNLSSSGGARNASSCAISSAVHGCILMSIVGRYSARQASVEEVSEEEYTATWLRKSVRPMRFQASAAVVIIRGKE
jgi:Na+/glutamate symporter